MIRVVVTDDSAVMRRLIADALGSADDIEVVGTAADGAEAVTICADLQPDVLTLDLSMPGMDGLEVLAALRASRSRVRVVVVSSFSPTLVERALDVLDAGATDLVAKPKLGDTFGGFGAAVVAAVRAASDGTRAPTTRSAEPSIAAIPRSTRVVPREGRVLVIAASTGGPRALGTVVPRLPPQLGAGAVLVQHMPPGFTQALAGRLDSASTFTVREAVDADRMDPTTLLVAPGGRHLRFDGAGVARLTDEDPIGGVRPRADLTIDDIVANHGAGTVLVVLTGMGNDGLVGARAVREADGIVLAQDEADCVVYGMPRHVVEADLADATGTLDALPLLIERALGTPITQRTRHDR